MACGRWAESVLGAGWPRGLRGTDRVLVRGKGGFGGGVAWEWRRSTASVSAGAALCCAWPAGLAVGAGRGASRVAWQQAARDRIERRKGDGGCSLARRPASRNPAGGHAHGSVAEPRPALACRDPLQTFCCRAGKAGSCSCDRRMQRSTKLGGEHLGFATGAGACKLVPFQQSAVDGCKGIDRLLAVRPMATGDNRAGSPRKMPIKRTWSSSDVCHDRQPDRTVAAAVLVLVRIHCVPRDGPNLRVGTRTSRRMRQTRAFSALSLGCWKRPGRARVARPGPHCPGPTRPTA